MTSSLSLFTLCPVDYMREVELARATDAEEQRARERQAFGDVRAKGITAVMNLFNKQGQLPMYYSGGLRLLADDMRDKRELCLIMTYRKIVFVSCMFFIG